MSNTSYYRTCPHCGAHLDPCERCDCQDKEKAAQGAADTLGGKMEPAYTTTNSIPIVRDDKGAVKP